MTKKCPHCGNTDIGEMIFPANRSRKDPDIEVECRKCGKKFKISFKPPEKE